MEQDDDYIMKKYMEYAAGYVRIKILITMYVKLYLKIK